MAPPGFGSRHAGALRFGPPLLKRNMPVHGVIVGTRSLAPLYQELGADMQMHPGSARFTARTQRPPLRVIIPYERARKVAVLTPRSEAELKALNAQVSR